MSFNDVPICVESAEKNTLLHHMAVFGYQPMWWKELWSLDWQTNHQNGKRERLRISSIFALFTQAKLSQWIVCGRKGDSRVRWRLRIVGEYENMTVYQVSSWRIFLSKLILFNIVESFIDPFKPFFVERKELVHTLCSRAASQTGMQT
jgi:hypothetical protein